MSEPSPRPPELLLAQLSELLAGQIGLHFPRERYGDLLRGIGAAAREFGQASIEACIHWLLASPLSRREVEILASHLTVGETYFFREPRSFEILEEHILADLIRARRHADRRLRIWSAGCCTGEEPYSIAMLLERLIPDIEEWNITILATDINPGFLRKAAQGVYGDWSFRAAPPWLRDRHFRIKTNGRFEIRRPLRKRVTFSYLNLADDAYPSLSNNTNAMDVILCRNVLMYFTPSQAKMVADKLHRSLLQGGWLIVSPTETSSSVFSGFSAVGFPGAVLYRKAAGAEPRVIAAGHPAPLPLPEPLYLASPMEPEEAPPPPPVRPAAAPGDAPCLEQARACANRGELAEAAECCEKAIAADKLNPACHYLLAAIQQELGQQDRAVQSLTRALYLDADFVLAHFALGNLRLARGRWREAERHFDTALSLSRAYPRDEVLPQSDGLTAGRLGEIIASVRSSLPGASNDGLA